MLIGGFDHTDLLLDFDADIESALYLTSSLRIRRIKKEEKYARYENSRLVPTWGQGLGIGREGRLFFAIEAYGASGAELELELQKLAALLLLFKPNPDLQYQLSRFSIEYAAGGYTRDSALSPLNLSMLEPGNIASPSYHLDRGELTPFKQFWRQSTIGNVWHPTLMATARRLLRLQSRKGPYYDEDCLVDVMTAFEALILDGENAKGATIARRISKLLQFSNTNLEQHAKANLENAYKLRNEAIHDGEFSPATLQLISSLSRFLVQLEEYLRISMNKYILEMSCGLTKQNIIVKFN